MMEESSQTANDAIQVDPEIEHQLTIPKNGDIENTDHYFDKDDLTLGKYYKTTDVYYQTKNGEVKDWEGKEIIDQKTPEDQCSKAVMDLECSKAIPGLMFQLFGEDIKGLLLKDREKFPICRYRAGEKMVCGIYLKSDNKPNDWYFNNKIRDKRDAYLNHDILYYPTDYPSGDPQFYIDYHGNPINIGNPFGTIELVKKCLQLWGEDGDEVIIKYKVREDRIDELKATLAKKKTMEAREDDSDAIPKVCEELKDYSEIVLKSKNVIFRGAPGTGKTHLARQIASCIVSGKTTADFESLPEEERCRIEFVQFHPSYDYADFVEGLRPKLNNDGTMGFELQPGIFKAFVERARKDSGKSYVFIIDEINRGEISKIFGELFFAIDPEYRGTKGGVSTQYANLHPDMEGKFYIPENVYIIGTMNDIDRSVDTFDFAMRRRFRFIELKAEDCTGMLDCLPDDKREKAIKRMNSLNAAIKEIEELSSDYHIGPAYFLKLKDETLDFKGLWSGHIEPLLRDYVRGMYDEKKNIEKLKGAYNLEDAKAGEKPQEDTVA